VRGEVSEPSVISVAKKGEQDKERIRKHQPRSMRNIGSSKILAGNAPVCLQNLMYRAPFLCNARPLHSRFSIYKHLRIFLTEKSAKIGLYFDGSCPPSLRKSSILNMGRQPLRGEFGKFLGKRLFRRQVCQGFPGFVKLGF